MYALINIADLTDEQKELSCIKTGNFSLDKSQVIVTLSCLTDDEVTYTELTHSEALGLSQSVEWIGGE